MAIYLVRVDGSDIAVAAPTMQHAIKATVAWLVEENAYEDGCDVDWAYRQIEQVVRCDTEGALIVDRCSWARFDDSDGVGGWRSLEDR